MAMVAKAMEIGFSRSLQVKVLVFFVPILQMLMGCGQKESIDQYKVRTEPMPDQILTDFEITETATGKKEWMMKADTAYVFEDRNLIETRRMVITFFDENGDVKSILHARRGRLNRKTDDMQAIGDVVVNSQDGTVLETQTLSWESGKRQIVTEDSVKIVRGNDELTGWGFSGDPDLGTFSIKSRMKAAIRSNKIDGEDSNERTP